MTQKMINTKYQMKGTVEMQFASLFRKLSFSKPKIRNKTTDNTFLFK